jgi:hypothetical protein
MMILRLSIEESAMLDAAFIIIGIAFFALSAWYALVCDRL